MTETELEVAYSETLEAWVESCWRSAIATPPGIPSAVLELTLRLAIQMGIPQEMFGAYHPRCAGCARYWQAGYLRQNFAQNRPIGQQRMARNARTSSLCLQLAQTNPIICARRWISHTATMRNGTAPATRAVLRADEIPFTGAYLCSGGCFGTHSLLTGLTVLPGPSKMRSANIQSKAGTEL